MGRLAIEGGIKSLSGNDFPADLHPLSRNDEDAVLSVLRSRRYSMFNNDTVRLLESKLEEYLSVHRCVVVSSCTAAIDASLRALGIQKGHEVILPAYTYAATLMAVLSAGATPVLADISLSTLTVDAECVEENVSPSTKAIIPVHLFGNPCDMVPLLRLREHEGIRLVEDCAHSIGASVNGIMTGAFDIGCFSFGENKILRVGEGGAVSSDDADFIRAVEVVRHEGEIWRRTRTSAASAANVTLNDVLHGIDYVTNGHNFRYSPILAAIGMMRLTSLEETIGSTRKLADAYVRRLRVNPMVRIPASVDNSRRVYSSFVVLLNDGYGIDRDTLFTTLAAEGVPIGVHFPIPLHSTSIYRRMFGLSGLFPNAERFCSTHLALPLYPSLSEEHVMKVCDVFDYVVNETIKRPSAIRQRAAALARQVSVSNFFSGVYVTI